MTETTVAVGNDLDDPSERVRGVQRLAGAVLVQAIDDLRSGSGKRRTDSLRWLRDPSEEQFSFVFCCRVLGRDAGEVRRFLERREMPNWIFSARLQTLPPPEQDPAESSVLD